FNTIINFNFYAGIINAPRRNVSIHFSSHISAEKCDFSGAGQRGLRISSNSSGSCEGSNFSNSYEGLAISSKSSVNAQATNFDNCDIAITATGKSNVLASSASMKNLGSFLYIDNSSVNL